MIPPRGFLAPKGTLAKKPPHGAPCNRCGLCCVAVICPLGIVVFGREQGPCPALEKAEDGAFACGLAAHPERYAPGRCLVHGRAAVREAAAALIGVGDGCDARFNGEPIDYAFYETLRQIQMKNRSRTRAAKKVWRVP